MSQEHQGLSADEIALLTGDDLDETGAPKEDEADRAAAAALAQRDAGAVDDEPGVASLPPAAPAPAPTPAQAAPAPAPEAAPEPAADTVAPEPRAASYNAGDPSQFGARAQAISQAKAEAIKKLMDGEIDSDQFAELDGKATSEFAALTRDQTLHEANVQSQQRLAEHTIEALKADGAKHGVDYATPGLAAMFDATLTALAAQPGNESKSFPELARAAHADVLKTLGKTTPAAAPTQQAPAAPANSPRSVDMSALPPTLSRVPPAADASIAGDEFAHLANLSGNELEKAVARMTPEQQERWLN